jgi:hypothetical protein
MKKNIFLGEASYRFIRIPVNQKYLRLMSKSAAAELLIQSIATSAKFMALENTKTDFHRFSNI